MNKTNFNRKILKIIQMKKIFFPMLLPLFMYLLKVNMTHWYSHFKGHVIWVIDNLHSLSTF